MHDFIKDNLLFNSPALLSDFKTKAEKLGGEAYYELHMFSCVNGSAGGENEGNVVWASRGLDKFPSTCPPALTITHC